MRKQAAYGERKAAEDRNLTEKSYAIRNKMQEKAHAVDDLTTSAGKCLAYGAMVAGGMVAGLLLHLLGTLWAIGGVLVVVALALGAMAHFGMKARKLINTPVAVRPDGSPLIM